MPVEIKELHIKATVQDAVPDQNQNVTAAAGTTTNIDDIVAICVEQVLTILKEKEER